MSSKIKTVEQALAVDVSDTEETFVIRIHHLREAWEEKFGIALTQQMIQQSTGISQATLSGYSNGFLKRVDLFTLFKLVLYFDTVLDEDVTVDKVIVKRDKPVL